MPSSPTTSWQIEGEKAEAVTDFIFLGSNITVDGDCSCEIINTCCLQGKLWQTSTVFWKAETSLCQQGSTQLWFCQ